LAFDPTTLKSLDKNEGMIEVLYIIRDIFSKSTSSVAFSPLNKRRWINEDFAVKPKD
jgi:hypothetical protein